MKINVFTLLTTMVVQFVVGYIWYGVHMFGGVDIGGHTIDFLKMDILTILLLIFSSYGLTHILETLVKTTGTKDLGGATKLGLTFGTFGIGLPMITLLNLMGVGHVGLLVVYAHVVIVSILVTMVVIKLKK